MLTEVTESCPTVKQETRLRWGEISRSQWYEWDKEIRERKAREEKVVDEEVVRNAVLVITRFPHFGGQKGQAFLLYHCLGLIARHVYNRLKQIVKKITMQEVFARKLLGEGKPYEHERPTAVNEIWSEDFGRIAVSGRSFYVSLVMDVYSLSYLGVEIAIRPSEAMVAKPVRQAMTRTGGKPPSRFLLSDNGRQYLSADHEKMLDALSIVHRLIPVCRPEYNGTMEGGVKEFKHVFYALWRKRRKEADKEKDVVSLVRAVAEDAVFHLNKVIPRPQLGGVTPADVVAGRVAEEQQRLAAYREVELQKEPTPLKKPLWQTVRECVNVTHEDDEDLLIRFYHFIRKPLRNITRYQLSGVGVG